MSDETPVEQAPAAETTPTAQAATTPAPAAEDTISLEEARKLRREAQSLRDRLKKFEDAEAEAKRAAMSEQERIAAEAAAQRSKAEQAEQARQTAERERDTLARQLAVTTEAAKRGLDPDLAARVIDLSQLERDERGQFTNVAKAVEAAIQRWPQLVLTGASATNPARTANLPKPPTPPITDRSLWRP